MYGLHEGTAGASLRTSRRTRVAGGELPEERAQDHGTDPASRLRQTSAAGFQPGCTAQVAVDGAQQLLVGAGVTSHASDQGGLEALGEAAAATQGMRPATVLADAGYCREVDLGQLEALGVDGYMAWGREGRRRGWIQEALGCRRCSVRGLRRVRGERDWGCLALNIKRMRGWQAA